MTKLETREMQVRAVNDEAREVSGIAVPWDTPTNIGGYTEIVKRGAITEPEGVKLFWRHNEPIGIITEHRDTAAGWEITARISQTPRGDEAYTLLRDGVIDKFSIGFEPLEEQVSRDGSSVTRTKIRVHEVSLVPNPAYEGAQVSQVREALPQEENPMTDSVTNADLIEVRQSIESLEREVKLAAAHKETEPVGDQFRSFGEYVKAVASGDEKALRAYSGAVSGDAILKDAWVGDLTRILGGKQPIKNSFTTGSLPSSGLSVEYAVLKSDTTAVGKQATEGADLAFGKVAIETKTAPVGTYGGYSSLSLQAIQRADVGILDTTFKALAVKYAKSLENEVRATVDAAYAATGGSALQSVALGATGDDDIKWITTLIDIAQKFDDNERSFEGLYVSKDVFLALAAIQGKDRFLQVAGGPAGQNAAGSISIPQLGGSMANIPVRIYPGWTGNKALAYDSFAVKTLESPGAPLRLQAENVVNLTKDFSVYGYGASFVQAPEGLVKVTFGA